MVRKISQKFVVAFKNGRQEPVNYRWGETYQGETEWTDWEEGTLIYEEEVNSKGEDGVNIKGVGGYGYAGREKDLEKDFGKIIFGRFSDESNQHCLQVKFKK
jgi:hypothetical protein